jgi:hypothetical protein
LELTQVKAPALSSVRRPGEIGAFTVPFSLSLGDAVLHLPIRTAAGGSQSHAVVKSSKNGGEYEERGFHESLIQQVS